MLQVPVNDTEEIRVWFQHQFNPDEPLMIANTPYKGMTICTLEKRFPENKNGGKFIVAKGQALCSMDDRFNYAAGRKIALRRALLTAFPGEKNKELRRMFWSIYFDIRGKVE